MARSGQAFFARGALGLLLLVAGCAAPRAGEGEGGTTTVHRLEDGTVEITPDAASRERQDWLERRRQDDQIRREIYNWLPRPSSGDPHNGG